MDVVMDARSPVAGSQDGAAWHLAHVECAYPGPRKGRSAFRGRGAAASRVASPFVTTPCDRRRARLSGVLGGRGRALAESNTS